MMNSQHVFYNGKIYTADEAKIEASAFIVEDGKILMVGNDEEVLNYADKATLKTDLQKKRVIPGMLDTHAHYLWITSQNFDMPSLQIDQALSHDEVLQLVKDYAEKYPVEEMPVISGVGWGMDCTPLASELDKAVSDRPVNLLDSGGHAGWVNSKALEVMGFTADTPDPVPGVSYLVRDDAGKPNGHYIEAEVTVLIAQKLKLNTADNIKRQFPQFCHDVLNSNGFTGFYDAAVGFVDEDDAFEALTQSDPNIRVFASLLYRTAGDVDAFLAMMKRLRDKYTSDKVRPTTLKMFKDGTVEAFSSLMFEDFCGHPNNRGIEILSNEKMIPMAKAAADEGFNIHIHAIGDKAISDALDVYEILGDISGTKTICHTQILPEDGIERFKKQRDVIYQTTPVWAIADQFTLDTLGEERYCRQMPLNTLMKNGTIVTFGSDAPVSNGMEGVNPFLEMHHAVNRSLGDGYVPTAEEGISIENAIKAYTINAAIQVKAEDELGSITTGKSADFVVLDQDIFSIPMSEIQNTGVEATYFKGELVYGE